MSSSVFARYDRQVWILVGGSLISAFGYSIAYPFISLYLYMYRGIPMADVGLALLIATLIGSLGQIAGGELCDRLGRKVVMNLGLVLNTVSFALLAVAIMLNLDYASFVLLMCLRQIAAGLYINVPTVMTVDLVKPGDRNGAFSLLRIGGNLGFALGPILGGILALHSYALMFAVTTVTSTAYLLISLFLLHDTKPERFETSRLGGSGAVWKDSPFLLFCIISAVVTVVYSQMLTTFSTYSGSYGGINESMIGLLFSLNGVMIVLLQYPIAIFLERFRLTTSLTAGALLYAIGFSIVGLSSGFWPLLGCVFIISLGELVFSPPSMNIVSRMASPESRGRYMGFSGLISNLGFAFGPFAGGFMMDAFMGQIKIMWLLIGGLAVASAFGFLLLRKTVRHEIDRSEGIVRVYPRLHRETSVEGPLSLINPMKIVRRQR